MAELFRPDLSHNERIDILQNTSEKVEETNYYAPLTQEQLDIKRERLTENLISIDAATEEFEKVKADHKAKVNPLKAENAILLTEVRTGQELKKGVLYHMANYDTGMMETYDSDGYLVSTRRLRPDEKKGQSKLFIPGGFKSTGTDS